jgi:uncharacterized membrane protein YjfL (UPF0719 family)
MEAFGVFGFIVAVVVLAWAVLMFCIPFMIFSIMGKLDKQNKLQQQIANHAKTAANNAYIIACSTEGE